MLDVGGVYDSSQDRYDHHQKGFDEVFGHGFNSKLSSAGLIYKVTDISNSKIGFYDQTIYYICAMDLNMILLMT